MTYMYYFFILIQIISGIDYLNNYRYNIQRSTPFYCSEYCYSYDYAESIYTKKLKKIKTSYNLISNISNIPDTSNVSNILLLVK